MAVTDFWIGQFSVNSVESCPGKWGVTLKTMSQPPSSRWGAAIARSSHLLGKSGMSFAVAVRGFAMGFLLAAITACGGGGGSGGASGGGLMQRPNVPLPDVSKASQKALTPDNSKRTVILALNAIGFIEDGSIPAEAAVDFYEDAFASTNGYSKTSRALRKIRPANKTVDVSSQFCVTGSATVDAGDSIIGTMVQHYRNCDLGGTVFDGDLQLDIRDYYSTEVFTDVTFTFKGLRITSSNDDSVFDGTVVTKTNYPGAGFITADLDIRDLTALKAMRVIGYRADFDIYADNGYYGNYFYTVKQLKGRIYDDEGEYFDLGLTPGFESWPMLLGKDSSLTLSPSGMAAPYQVKLALDTDGNGFAENWLFAALDQLALSGTNDNAPVFQAEATRVRIEKGESRTVSLGIVTDADQQFVNVGWQLVNVPPSANPSLTASADGFVFSSGVAGDYQFVITASDGAHTTTQNLNVRVMYDMPQINANVPSSVRADDNLSFHVDVLNPEQGNVTVTPLAIPGLSYDAGTATFHSALPSFGVDQQINVGFVVANEDRSQTVTFPVTVTASANSAGPLMLASDYSWYSITKSWVGHFTDDSSVEAVDFSYQFLHLYEIGPQGKRYRESFDINAALGSGQYYILGTADLDDDGIDELVISAQNGTSSYLCTFDVKRRQVIQKVLIDTSAASISSYKFAVADLNGDGSKELSLLTDNGITILDSDLNMQWQSERGYFGSFLLAVNFDNDAAIELVTNTGYVLDGVSKIWQQRRGLYANGTEFFAVDVDNDGMSEIFLVDDRTLHQLTNSGYVDRDVGASITSNMVLRNLDGDVTPEVVFITNHDASSNQGPFPPYWVEGAASLAYLDFNGGNISVVLTRELQRGSFISYALYYVDVDGDGNAEYLGLNSYNGTNNMASFIYEEDTDSQEFLENVGLRLVDKPIGGMSMTNTGNKLVFCGAYIMGDGAASKMDLYTFDVDRSRLNDNLTASIDGAGSTLINNYSQCFSSKLEGSDTNYVVTVTNEDGYYSNLGNVAIKIQDPATGDAVFTLRKNIGQYSSFSAIGDISGDQVSDMLVAGNSKLVVLDTHSGNQLAAFDFVSESITAVKISDVIPGNGRDEVIVRTSSQLAILAYGDDGAFKVATQIAMQNYYGDAKLIQVFDANGDGSNDIVVSSTDYQSSGQFTVSILDAGLKTLATWTAPGVEDDLQLFNVENGSTLFVSLERETYGYDSTVVWRDPMTGQLISRSPKLPDTGYGKLNLAFDAQTSKTRVVVTGNDRVYIAQ